MKKTLYILSLLLLGLVSCTKTELEAPDAKNAEETGLVAVTMKVQIPQAQLYAQTKAALGDRSETPSIKAIRVAVFGESGYPQTYAYAEPVDASGNPVADYATTNHKDGTDTDIYYFKVLLPVYEGEAHMHIIANGDETIKFNGEKEESIMSAMKTTGNVGAYWARIVSLDGILPQKDKNGIMQTDRQGNFIPSDETKELFSNLVLVRNFAEVRLQSNVGDDLKEISWTLVNVPTTGSIAPMAAGTWVDNYKDYVYNKKTGRMVLADLDEDGNVIEPAKAVYDGFMFEADPMDYNPPTDLTIKNGISDPGFVFERLHPGTDKATCILMKAKFKNDDYFTYYRLDLSDERVGGYYPIYRNYAYVIKINKVGNRGSRSITDALNRDSGGNVSLSNEARKLTDISDGDSRLYVEYVEKNFTSGGKKEKGLRVRYVPDVTTGVVNNSTIKVEVKDGELGTALVSSTPLTLTPTSESSQTGWYFYDFELNEQSKTTDLVSVLKVSADNGKTGDDKSTLYRDITLRVIKKMDMKLSLKPKHVDGQGDATILSIELPIELPESMFPLEFKIEDINHSLYATGFDGSGKSITIPVKTDKSLVDGKTSSFYFIRTVNYDDYNPEKGGSNIVTTQFKTNKDASATTIYVANEYFEMQHTNLLNDGVYVNPVKAEVAFNVTSVQVEVEFAEEATDKTWTVTHDSDVTITDLDGNELTGQQSGTGKFLMKFAENNSTTASATRTARVTSNGKGHDVIITQSPLEFSVTPATQTVNSNVTTATVTVHAEEGKAWTASVNNGASLSATSGTGTQTLTVTMQPHDGTSARQYTVTATMTDPAGTATATITQRRTPTSPYPFAANEFTFTGTSAKASSGDGGYIEISLENASTNSSRTYLTIGDGNNSGTITITPVNGFQITGILVTYSSSQYAGYAFGNRPVSVNTGTYTRNGNNSQYATWTGSSTGPIIFTDGYQQNLNSRSYPRIRGIQVTFKAVE